MEKFFVSALDLDKKNDKDKDHAKRIIEVTGDQAVDIAIDTIHMNKQALIFVSTRNSAEALAERIAKSCVSRGIVNSNSKESGGLEELSKKILSVLSSPTKQCKRLSRCILGGVAFHHSGLPAMQRELVENAFREGVIRIIVATPTLAYGLNLPAFRVVVRDLKRYNPSWGYVWIPTLEYLQFIGRAGRPGLEEYGEAIAIASSENEREKILKRYIYGYPEEITSKLAAEPVFRTYLLAAISSGYANTMDELNALFLSTFHAYSYGDINALESNIARAINSLVSWGFIVLDGEKLKPTRIGKRVSELYLDCLLYTSPSPRD